MPNYATPVNIASICIDANRCEINLCSDFLFFFNTDNLLVLGIDFVLLQFNNSSDKQVPRISWIHVYIIICILMTTILNFISQRVWTLHRISNNERVVVYNFHLKYIVRLYDCLLTLNFTFNVKSYLIFTTI